MSRAYTVVHADDIQDAYASSDVPGEFHSLTKALESEQVAITLIRVPPHSDFEQGTGHRHAMIEELYLVTQGTLTMRFDDAVVEIGPGSVARVAANTVRSHRNEHDEPVELWAMSKCTADSRATKIDEFWEASNEADQHR